MNRIGRHPPFPFIESFVGDKNYNNGCNLFIKANLKHQKFEIALKFGIIDDLELNVVIPYKKRNPTCLVKFDDHEYLPFSLRPFSNV